MACIAIYTPQMLREKTVTFVEAEHRLTAYTPVHKSNKKSSSQVENMNDKDPFFCLSTNFVCLHIATFA